MNAMQSLKIEKLTLNIGAGKDQKVLERGMKLLKNISGIDPIKTITDKRIPAWGVRPGLPVGCKLTVRDQKLIADLISRSLKARENKLKKSCFDEAGNISFGVHEYIEVPGLEYDPEVGIMGFQVSVTLERPGYAIKRKTLNTKSVGKKHRITQDDAISFMKENFAVEIEGENDNE